MDTPPPEKIASIVDRAADKMEEEGLDKFYPSDVAKLKNNKAYAARFWHHQPEGGKGDRDDNAVNMIINTFRWRKEFGEEEITEESLNKDLLGKGVIFSHNRDRKGKKLLVINMKNHYKGVESMRDCQAIIVYFLERLEREEGGGPVTVVYDGTGMGYANLDLSLYQFVVHLLVDIYPAFMENALMLEMPWIFNAVWKVIKVVIPAHILDKTKFVNKSQIGEYIDDDNKLKSWGGKDDYKYVFESET